MKRRFSGNGGGNESAAREAPITAPAHHTATGQDPENFVRILKQRAAQFATPPVEEEPGESLDLVIVQIGPELYGIEAQYVFRIRPASQITRVPRVPPWIAGVTNERGRVLSVFDLRRFLKLPSGEDGPESYLALVATPEMELALRIGAVLNVVSLPLRAIQPSEDVIRGIPPEYVRGLTTETVAPQEGNGEGKNASAANEVTTVVLDLRALLADEQLIVHEEIV